MLAAPWLKPPARSPASWLLRSIPAAVAAAAAQALGEFAQAAGIADRVRARPTNAACAALSSPAPRRSSPTAIQRCASRRRASRTAALSPSSTARASRHSRARLRRLPRNSSSKQRLAAGSRRIIAERTPGSCGAIDWAARSLSNALSPGRRQQVATRFGLGGIGQQLLAGDAGVPRVGRRLP